MRNPFLSFRGKGLLLRDPLLTALGSFMSLPTSAGGAQKPQVGSSPAQSGSSGDPDPTEPEPFPDEPIAQHTARRLGSEGGLW